MRWEPVHNATSPMCREAVSSYKASPQNPLYVSVNHSSDPTIGAKIKSVLTECTEMAVYAEGV